MTEATYKIRERIEKDGYEQALLYFETEMIPPNYYEIGREKKFMKAIKDGWIPIIQTVEHNNHWAYFEFLMKRKLK